MTKQIDGLVNLDIPITIDINDIWEKLSKEQCDKFFFTLLEESYSSEQKDIKKIIEILNENNNNTAVKIQEVYK